MEATNLDSTLSFLSETFGCETTVDQYGLANAICGSESLLAIVQELKTKYGFQFLTDICACAA